MLAPPFLHLIRNPGDAHASKEIDLRNAQVRLLDHHSREYTF